MADDTRPSDRSAAAKADETVAPRPLRADAVRNRERLLETAKAAFAEVGPDLSLDEIARRAGVGIGTLYRHFPSREAVVAAVYEREVRQIAEAARRLSREAGPLEALRQWMRLFIDYLATKKGLSAALGAMVGNPPPAFAAAGGQITEAMTLLVDRAVASGEVRRDVDVLDLMRGLAGLAYGAATPGWEAGTLRLVDILVDGLKAPPSGS